MFLSLSSFLPSFLYFFDFSFSPPPPPVLWPSALRRDVARQYSVLGRECRARSERSARSDREIHFAGPSELSARAHLAFVGTFISKNGSSVCCVWAGGNQEREKAVLGTVSITGRRRGNGETRKGLDTIVRGGAARLRRRPRGWGGRG